MRQVYALYKWFLFIYLENKSYFIHKYVVLNVYPLLNSIYIPKSHATAVDKSSPFAWFANHIIDRNVAKLS